jgi:hypothetical protein
MQTDMVGPAAPTLSPVGVGDTLLTVNWNPSTDPADTQGFNVYIDPPPGQSPSDASQATTDGASSGDGTGVLICPDSGSSSSDAATDADGATDAASDGPVDSGCYYSTPVNSVDGGGPGGTTSCPSTVLVGGGGTQTEAGTTGGTQVLLPSQYLVDSLVGNTTSSYTIQGLTNGFNYTVAVAATDGSANTGPLSTPSCAIPAPVDDFWKRYRQAGGSAGVGFCALETFGEPGAGGVLAASVVLAGAAWARRRRRR